MGPSLGSDGKVTYSIHSKAGKGGFNGAVAWERRKDARFPNQRSLANQCFNGAVAWERRKAPADAPASH